MGIRFARLDTMCCLRALVALCLGAYASALVAQESAIPIRSLSPIIATSVDSVSDASSIRALGDGRVLVNDPRRRSVLLFDSTLQRAVIVADTTSATAKTYGAGLIGMMPFTGDSSMVVDQLTGALLVIDPTGKVARIIAARGMTRAATAAPLDRTLFFDHTGHLIFGSPPTIFLSLLPFEFVGDTLMRGPDSTAILRRDMNTRRIDTIAMLKAPRIRQAVTRRVNGGSGRSAVNPMPSSDDWTVLHDGTVAVVRVTDYHIDWIRPDGSITSSPKIPTRWARLTDSTKRAIIDSIRTLDLAAGIGRDDGAMPLAQRRVYVEPADLPDYKPPFTSGFARADADGDVWVRTNQPAPNAGNTVYDVINRSGVLVDRVQVSSSATILGFGPGVVYLIARGTAGSRISKAPIH